MRVDALLRFLALDEGIEWVIWRLAFGSSFSAGLATPTIVSYCPRSGRCLVAFKAIALPLKAR
jgi:hypothetical protein